MTLCHAASFLTTALNISHFLKVILFLHVLEFKRQECHISFLLANRFLLRCVPAIGMVACPDSRLRLQTILHKRLQEYLLRSISQTLRVTKSYLWKYLLILHTELTLRSGHPIPQSKELTFQLPYLVRLPTMKKETWSGQKATLMGLRLPIAHRRSVFEWRCKMFLICHPHGSCFHLPLQNHHHQRMMCSVQKCWMVQESQDLQLGHSSVSSSKNLLKRRQSVITET